MESEITIKLTLRHSRPLRHLHFAQHHIVDHLRSAVTYFHYRTFSSVRIDVSDVKVLNDLAPKED